MNQLQRRVSNGTWYDEDRAEPFVGMAAEYNGITTDEVKAKLDAGQELRFRAGDWYPCIRNKPAPRKRKFLGYVRGHTCRGCGGSEFTGAIFTTMPGSGYCDNCV